MEGEAIIGFAERQILTTHRFVIMSSSKIPIVEQSIPLAEINKYKIENMIRYWFRIRHIEINFNQFIKNLINC